MQEAEAISDGAISLRPGVLYSALGRLADQGLIEERGDRPASELDDKRRRYYRITPEGMTALGSEMRRLQAIVKHGLNIEPAWSVS